jgi:hypothetical protein
MHLQHEHGAGADDQAPGFIRAAPASTSSLHFFQRSSDRALNRDLPEEGFHLFPLLSLMTFFTGQRLWPIKFERPKRFLSQ